MMSGNAAFGRYARRLRESRGLSLRRVCELSCDAPSPIDKATLSRLEHGRQSPGVGTLIALSRIYAVPVESLVERFELDGELARIGEPEIPDQDSARLAALGRVALLQHSDKWSAYGLYRASAERPAKDDPARAADPEAERMRRRLDLATVARSLGKNRYALSEYDEIARSGKLAEHLQPVLLDRVSNCERCLGNFAGAEAKAIEAARWARELGDGRALGFALLSLASCALDQGDLETGIGLLMQSARAECQTGGEPGRNRLAPNPTFRAQMLVKLAHAYLAVGRTAAAGRTATAARRVASGRGLDNPLAYAEIVLGTVEAALGRDDRAIARWRRAGAVGARLRNPRLTFAAEIGVLRHAVLAGRSALARSSRSRLARLVPQVPLFVPQLAEYRDLLARQDRTTRALKQRRAPRAATGRRKETPWTDT